MTASVRTMMMPWRGQTLVEFALTVPLFLTVIFAVIQVGALALAQMALTDAATSGARAVTIRAADADADTLVCDAVLKSLASSTLPVDHLQGVTIFQGTGTGLTANSTDNTVAHDVGTCAADGTFQPTGDMTYRPSPDVRLVSTTPQSIGVTVTYSYYFIVPWFVPSITIQHSYISRIEEFDDSSS